MANQLVYKINSQPSQIEVAKGGVTLYNIGPGQITVSTKTSFPASRTASLSQYFAMPWTSAPLWARSTSEPTLLVIPGQHNIVSPQVTLSGETVNITGTVHLAPTAKVTIDGDVVLAAGTQVGLSGGQLRTSSGQALQSTGTTLLPSDLGTGKNGSVTLSANTTLTSTGEYTTLTIDAGVTLATAGYVVRAIGTVTVDGTVANNGGAANRTAGGLGAPMGALNGGANGVWSNGIGGVTGHNAPAASIQGGPGGAVTGNTKGVVSGGSATPIIAGSPSFALLHAATMAGGASGAVYMNNSTGSAGSGGAGGPILILCTTFAGSGTIESLGGAGYVGTLSENRAGGSGGGPVIVGCRTTTFTGTLESAGSAGTGTGPGAKPGGRGTVRLLVAT